jgi:antitoxin MazE
MQVSKWGNSLAIRLPAAVVDALELKEGDHIEVTIAGARSSKFVAIAAGKRRSSD